MASVSIGTKIVVNNESERKRIDNVINKSYTPKEKEERLKKIKSHVKSNYRIIN